MKNVGRFFLSKKQRHKKFVILTLSVAEWGRIPAFRFCFVVAAACCRSPLIEPK
jgi:hypothetical protein